MPGQDLAGVLDPEVPLDRRLEQVAPLTDDPDDKPKDHGFASTAARASRS